MLNTANMKEFFQKQLDDLEQDKRLKAKLKFKVYPEFGELNATRKEKLINAGYTAVHVDALESPVAPFGTFENVPYRYSLRFVTSVTWGNILPTGLQSVIKRLVRTLNDKQFTIGEGLVHFSFDSPQSDPMSAFHGKGDSVVVSLGVYANYTVSGVTSANSKWLLDGEELEYTQASISVDRMDATNSMQGEEFTKSLVVQQTLRYDFRGVPYNRNNKPAVQIRKDILSGELGKTYKLTHWDGVAWTKGEPFVRTVQLAFNPNADQIRTQVGDFNVSFKDADTVSREGVRWYIALIDTPFDASTIETLLFEDGIDAMTGEKNNLTMQENQQAYYEHKVKEQGGVWKQIRSPNMQNLMEMQQVYFNDGVCDMTDEVRKPFPKEVALMKNFAVVKKVDWGAEAVEYYRFYSINKLMEGAGSQILLTLSAHTVQIHIFRQDFNLGQCMMERVQRAVHKCATEHSHPML